MNSVPSKLYKLSNLLRPKPQGPNSSPLQATSWVEPGCDFIGRILGFKDRRLIIISTLGSPMQKSHLLHFLFLRCGLVQAVDLLQGLGSYESPMQLYMGGERGPHYCWVLDVYKKTIRKNRLRWCHKCSRSKPSYEFHFEGFSNFSSLVEGLVQIQDNNPRM